MTIYTYLVI